MGSTVPTRLCPIRVRFQITNCLFSASLLLGGFALKLTTRNSGNAPDSSGMVQVSLRQQNLKWWNATAIQNADTFPL